MSLELAIKDYTRAAEEYTRAAEANTSAIKALTEIWTKLAAQGTAVAARITKKTAAGEDANLTAGGVLIAEIKAEAPKVEAPDDEP